ncbi:fasciclin domain-containing protein [Catalinimonas niigatensis]|uniref:fasciclin domain-containing protein n=1 Tax=Catalinimonas niigatensis TaxID=1397264 RepID=UPI00266640ED|nr:fasciclin domain-containing protein [Catalinimonas niigatensis]WPP50080.1 fasciclin domain-containing protein [Catalinimonas niigatensis]
MFLNTNNNKINRILSIFLALTVGVVMMSCEEDDDIIDDDENNLTIYGEVTNSPGFTFLTAAIDKANLTDRLDAEGSYTLLAPSDNAFINAGITDLDDYTSDELAEILEYHVIEDEVLVSELADVEKQETLNGTLYVVPTERYLYLNGNTLIGEANVETVNGVIHVVDRVLSAPQSQITAIIEEDENLNILQEAIAQAGVGDVLSKAGPFTIFAPTDEAFEKLFDELEVSSISELSNDRLAKILQYHVIEDRAFSPALEVGSQSTLLGETFTITFDNAILLVDENEHTANAVVVAGNRLGTNGVVHYVDEVLLPEEE